MNSRSARPLLLVLALAGTVAGAREAAADAVFERLTTADGLPHNGVYSVLQDRTGFLWLATEGGLARFDGYHFTRFVHDPGDPGSLAAADVRQILEDRDGDLWIATWGGGLDRLDPRTERIVHVGPGDGGSGGLGDRRVQSLYQDRQGTLWVGTFAGGLHRLDGPTHRPRSQRPAGEGFESYLHDPGDPASLSHNRVGAVRQDPLGFLWIATADGLSLLDPASGGFQVFRHRPGEAAGLSHSNVRALHVDRAGDLWVGTEGGLDRFHRPTKTFERIALGTPAGRTPVNAIHEDRRGNLWIGTAGGGLVHLDRASGAVRRFLHHPDAPESLGDDDVRALWEDRTGILWVGTRGGGLSKLSLSLPSGVDDGRGPPVVLTAVRRFDQALDLGVVPAAAETIELSWEDADLTFEFAALDFTRPRDNRYRYRLEGFDRGWTDAGDRRQASYDDLPPGRYTLRVRAASSAGVWNEEGLAVALVLAPPWWRTLWFRLGLALLIFAAALLADRLRIGRLMRRERELARRVEEGLEERRKSDERYRLLRSQKLESLALLAGGIAHDFNNLLTAILGHAELARGELDPGSRARARLDQIEQAAERAAGLSKQMLAYSGKGSFLTNPLDVSAAVAEMAPLLAAAVPDRVALSYDLARDLPPVDADGSQLSQVLLSLVTNAAEAIGDGDGDGDEDRHRPGDPPGGTITLATGVVRCDREYLAGTFLDEQLEAGDYVFFEVRDDGCGMDAETQRKIFDPFFTTKFAGRGLGLAAVLGIVRGHRGAIEIDSEPRQGTTIRVLLPVDRRPPAALPAASAEEESWRGSGTLLLVDDEPQVRMVGEEMAKLLGFEVLAAAGGREGIELFRRHDEIALVVLDLAMPRMDGAEVFAEMCRIRSGVPVLLATGYDEQETMERLGDRGFAGFIQKPYRLSALRQKLRDALAAGRPAPAGAS